MPNLTGRWKEPLLAAFLIHASSLVSPAVAEDDDSEACIDKSRYTLFNPTPLNCMREFAPDRPDLTDNPFTVDAGHVQLEADLVNYSLSRPDPEGTVTEKFLFGTTDIRVGLTNNIEVDALVQPINAVHTQFVHPSMDDWAAGPDTLEIGSKFNLYGNDTFEKPGSIALGIRPFIEIPTVHNGVGEEDVEGGVSALLAIKLSTKTELEMMTEYDIVKDEEGSGYHVEYFNSASYEYEWNSKISTYFEVATLFGNEDPSGGIVQFGAGILYQPRENVQIDVGSNFGVTRASDRINPFVGITKRF
jgi:outer membrane putative beta-barrel porin/alpha-amylase